MIYITKYRYQLSKGEKCLQTGWLSSGGGGTVYLWSNGSGTEGEHKELTTPQAQYPLVSSKTTVLGVPTERGEPLKKGGVGGVFLWGLGKGSPVGLDNVQGLYILWLAVARHFCGSKNEKGIGETPDKLYLRHEVASKCDACQIPLRQ
jgi:hypothetical protein